MDGFAANRYALVPKAGQETDQGLRIRRFSLARVRVSPRSELGFDRHARLERVAGFEEGDGSPPPDR